MTELINKFSFSWNYTTFEFNCDFVITAASAAALDAACDTAEAALTVREKKLLLSWFSATEYSFDHADNTGFLGIPTLRKIDDELSTATSRHYQFNFSCELPAEVAKQYQREAHISVSYDPARRITVDFSGVYTAGGANTASANYLLYGPTWSAGILTTIGGDYERLNENYTFDHENKLCDFRLTYLERLEYDVASGGHATIVNALVNYELNSPQSFGGSPIQDTNPKYPPSQISVSYSCSLDNTKLTGNTTAETLYRTEIKPWLISHLKDVLNLSAHPEASNNIIIQNERYNWNPNSCDLSGSLDIFSAPNEILEFSESIRQTLDPGTVFEKLYDGLNYTYALWGKGQEIFASQEIQIAKMNSRAAEPSALSAPWVPIADWTRSDSADFLGYAAAQTTTGAATLKIYRSSFSRNYVYTAKTANQPTSTGTEIASSAVTENAAESNVKVSIDQNTGAITVLGQSGGK